MSWGALVRADSLERLDAAGWAALEAHEVRTVVDLRNADEIGEDAAPRSRESRAVSKAAPRFLVSEAADQRSNRASRFLALHAIRARLAAYRRIFGVFRMFGRYSKDLENDTF